MRLPVLFLVLAISVLFFGSADAQEIWTCTYPGYGQRPVLTRFRVEGNYLVDGEYRYTILENNNLGLVAVRAFANLHEQRGPEIGSFVVLINKKTRQFKHASVLLSRDIEPASGTCLPQ